MKYLKWNFPLLRALKSSVEKRGIIKTLFWFLAIVVGLKVVLINGSIAAINLMFGTKIPYGPIGQTIGEYIAFII